MHALCVGRHSFLAAHISAFFRSAGLVAEPVVGLDAALVEARRRAPGIVVCDYDLLTQGWLAAWNGDPRMEGIPLIAVSLTRRPEEVNLADVRGVAEFLYLPTLDNARLQDVMALARSVAPPAGQGYDRPTQAIANPAP